MTTRKKKKKQPELSPFSHMTPILPDSDKSLDKFNEMSDVNISGDFSGGMAMGESVEKLNVDKLNMEIVTTTIDYMVDNGFEEDEANAYTDFDIIDEGDRIKVEVRVDGFGMDMEGELCIALNPVVLKYDQDAYFDLDYPGILVAYIDKDVSVVESLDRIDRHNNSYNLGTYYRMNESALSAQDKKRLKQFVDKTDNTDDIETFMKGLLEKSKNIKESIDTTDELELEFEQHRGDCTYNIDGQLPEDVQNFIDEVYNVPWIAYGQLPSGHCFFYDADGDLDFYKDLDDFISDMRYNMEQWGDPYNSPDINESIKGDTLTEASMSPEEKMAAWHRGDRRENIKACGDEKLFKYFDICDANNYKTEKTKIMRELNDRGYFLHPITKEWVDADDVFLPLIAKKPDANHILILENDALEGLISAIEDDVNEINPLGKVDSVVVDDYSWAIFIKDTEQTNILLPYLIKALEQQKARNK